MRKLFALALLGLIPTLTANAQGVTTVKGRVVWDADKNGPPPARQAIKPTKDEEVCAKDKDFKTEDWVINAKTNGIKNVVVWLAPEPKPGGAKLRDLPPFDPKDIPAAAAKPAKETVEIWRPSVSAVILAAPVSLTDHL